MEETSVPSSHLSSQVSIAAQQKSPALLPRAPVNLHAGSHDQQQAAASGIEYPPPRPPKDDVYSQVLSPYELV